MAMDPTSLRVRVGGGRWWTFFLTFFSFAAFHVSRKTFSAIKGVLADQHWFESVLFDREDQTEMQGLLDSLFLFMYAFGLFFSGIIGDRYNLRYVLSIGMTLSALLIFLFGLGGLVGIHSLGYFAALWALNGLVQSLGWPANVAVMGNWFGVGSRGGIWSGNASFGNIVGTAVTALCLGSDSESTGKWEMALFAAACLVMLETVALFTFLVPHPSEAGLEDPNTMPETTLAKPAHSELLKSETARTTTLKAEADTTSLLSGESKSAEFEKLPAIPFLEALCLPGVIPYSISYACLKSVNYALFFWLPFYLKNEFHMSDERAALFSMNYDLGQILGGFLGGLASDKLGFRAPVTMVMMLTASTFIIFLREASIGMVGILLVLTGFFMGGPANLISTCISADLGTLPQLRGNARALSTVAGIIDGSGSVGAALVQYLVGAISDCRWEPPGCDDAQFTGIHQQGPYDAASTSGHGANAGSVEHSFTDQSSCVEVCSWQPVFVMLIVGDLLAAICLSGIVRKEMAQWMQKRRGAQI